MLPERVELVADLTLHLARLARRGADIGLRLPDQSVAQHVRDHPVSLCLEVLVAHLVCPDSGADRLPDPLAPPGLGIARVRPVPRQECLLEPRIPAEVLGGKPGQVRQGRPQLGPAEVDHADHAIVDQPVARLPVPVGRDENDRVGGPGFHGPTEDSFGLDSDAVRAVQPLEALPVGALLVAGVALPRLIVQQGQQTARLFEGVRLGRGHGVEHQVSRLPVGHQQVRRAVVAEHGRGSARRGQRLQPVQVCVDLPCDVVVGRTACLDSEAVTFVLNLQYRTLDQAPTVVAHQTTAGEPPVHQLPLVITQGITEHPSRVAMVDDRVERELACALGSSPCSVGRMRSSRLAAVVVALLVVVMTTLPSARADTPQRLGTSVDDFVRAYLDRHGLPGASVAVVQDGDLVYEQGYGADSDGAALSPTTPLRLASVSKSFTAFAVLQLVDRGRVELDAPVVDYLPDFHLADSRGDDITVRQLLSHTSGIPSPTIVSPAQTPAEAASAVGQLPLSSTPGSSYRYSNLNYWVAAWLVEVVSGRSVDDYLAAEVFQPLGMTGTQATTTSSTPVDGLVDGHVTAYGTAFDAPEPEQMFAGAGGVSSTAADMSRWLAMYQRRGTAEDGARILSPALVDEALAPQPNAGRAGLGWAESSPGITPARISTSGVLGTFNAQQDLVPSSGYGVVVLLNSYTPTREHAYAISSGIIALTEGGTPDLGTRAPMIIDLALAALTALVLALGVRGVLRAERWADRRRAWPVWRLLLRLLPQLVMPALAFILFVVGSSLRGNSFTPADIFRIYPALTVLVLAAAVVGLVLTVLRLSRHFWDDGAILAE